MPKRSGDSEASHANAPGQQSFLQRNAGIPECISHVAVIALWIGDARSSPVLKIAQGADHVFAVGIHFQAAMAVGVADHQARGAHLVADAPGSSWCLDAEAVFLQDRVIAQPHR